jgi:hypothetical protein
MSDHQSSRRIFGLGSRHPRKVAFLRIAIGIYLLVLTAILGATGSGEPWAWVTGVFAAVHFALAYRLLRIAREHAGLQAGVS